jgi:hypothetical protein
MPNYQKAYRLGDLKKFKGWQESAMERGGATSTSATDDDVVFLREDLTVARGCFPEDPTIFTDSTPEWRRFCREDLGFRVPDWDEESRRVREAVQALEEGARRAEGA